GDADTAVADVALIERRDPAVRAPPTRGVGLVDVDVRSVGQLVGGRLGEPLARRCGPTRRDDSRFGLGRALFLGRLVSVDGSAAALTVGDEVALAVAVVVDEL